VFRICRRKLAATAFNGVGASLYPGRWNHREVGIVYCASSLALAQLEYLVHVDRVDAPEDLVWIRCVVPDDVWVARLTPHDLPDDWRDIPGPWELKDIGFEWCASSASVALEVPSVIVPSEYNVLLNPAHPDSGRLAFDEPIDLVFDPRLIEE